MKEILKGIYTWGRFSELKGFDFNGWLILSGDGNVMVDPPLMTPEEEAQIAQVGAPAHIVVTNRDHDREAARYRDLYGAQTWMHESDAPLVELKVDHAFRHGDRLPGGMEVIHVPDNKSPGESALLLHREPNVLILGDALIGHPPGALTLLPPDKYADIQKAREGIRVLLNSDFGPVLTSDGASLLEGGRRAIEAFLKR
ncbi:MAG: hypothetical protein EXS64_18005 [Candidatus Latescibacteria bacterium]|nr:hypothetical protein [Candidatus Latescibacterota bacterium]